MIKKYKLLSIQTKATIWYLICNIIQRGISFFAVPVYIRLLTTYEYGKYTVFQSWKEILLIVVTLNLYCGVYTKALVDYSDRRDEYTSSMQGLTTLLSLLWFAIYSIFKDYWISFFNTDSTTVLLLFLYFIFSPSFTFWTIRQRVEYRYKRMVVVTLLLSLIIPIISVVLLKNTYLHSKALIWSYLIIQTLFGLFFYIHQFIKGKVFFDKNYWKHAITFNIPLIPHYLSLIVLSQADRIMIDRMIGSNKAGIYSFAYSIALLMNIITSAINGSIVPWIYEKLKKKEYNSIEKVVNPIIIFLAIATFLVMLVSPEIVRIIGTHDYYEATYIIPAVSVSAFITFCYGLYSNIEFYYSKTKYVMIASSTGAIINIILNYFFINKFGYIAAGYTTLASYLILFLMHYLYYKKILNEVNIISHVYGDNLIILCCFILIIAMFICLFMYKHLIIRYSVALLILMFIIHNKRRIISILKEIRK